MKLVDIDPTPNGAPSIKERCPHKVLVAGLTYDAPDPTIQLGKAKVLYHSQFTGMARQSGILIPNIIDNSIWT